MFWLPDAGVNASSFLIGDEDELREVGGIRLAEGRTDQPR